MEALFPAASGDFTHFLLTSNLRVMKSCVEGVACVKKQALRFRLGSDLKSRTNTHLYVANGEDHRVGQVDFVGILVDGGRDDGWVDDDGVVGGRGLAAQFHAGVLRGEVDPDVFVEDEGDPDLTCRVTEEGKTFRSSFTAVAWRVRCRSPVTTLLLSWCLLSLRQRSPLLHFQDQFDIVWLDLQQILSPSSLSLRPCLFVETKPTLLTLSYPTLLLTFVWVCVCVFDHSHTLTQETDKKLTKENK